MKDAIVIGCGIVGATITKALQLKGMDVLTLDDAQSMGGTAPSGGHLKPSWFGTLSKDEYKPSMELLDELWKLKEEQFVIRPTGIKTTVYRVDTDKVLETPRTTGRVTAIGQLHNYPTVVYSQGMEQHDERCRLLIVATGVWAAALVPSLTVTAKQGVSFRVRGYELCDPFIKPWAPYKQVVAHQQAPNELWVGDGTAVLAKNWTKERTKQCLDRCIAALGQPPIQAKPPGIWAREGLRAYTKPKGNPCLLEQLGPRAWVATGAGKSGTIAAGWAAWRILNCLPS